MMAVLADQISADKGALSWSRARMDWVLSCRDFVVLG
jgi:hypothetical protein